MISTKWLTKIKKKQWTEGKELSFDHFTPKCVRPVLITLHIIVTPGSTRSRHHSSYSGVNSVRNSARWKGMTTAELGTCGWSLCTCRHNPAAFPRSRLQLSDAAGRAPEPWIQRREPPLTSEWTSAPTRPLRSPRMRRRPVGPRNLRTHMWLSSPWPSKRARAGDKPWAEYMTTSSPDSRTMRRTKRVGRIASGTICLSMSVLSRCPETAEGTGRATFGCWTPHLRTCLKRGTTGGGGGWGGPTDRQVCLTWQGTPWNTRSRFTCSLTWAAPGVCASPARPSRRDTHQLRSSLATVAARPPAARWAHTARLPTSTTLPTVLTTATRPRWSRTTGTPTAESPRRWAPREAPLPCRAATSSSPPTRGRRRRSIFARLISRSVEFEATDCS